MKITSIAVAAFAVIGGAASAQAADSYVAISGAFSILNNSDNEGAFVGPFTTGAGTIIPAGAVLPDGTPVGWTTDFNNGYAISAAYGRRYGMLRGELELAWQRNGVDSHRNVSAGGLSLGSEDAGVLVTGSPNLGVTVADLVADGQGSLRTIYLMANALVDVPTGGPITPYIGGGAGVGFVNVDYSPSGVTIIDDGSTEFAWQAMAGASWALTTNAEVFAGYRYRRTSDVSVEASLFSAAFEVKNRGSLIEAGLRYSF